MGKPRNPDSLRVGDSLVDEMANAIGHIMLLGTRAPLLVSGSEKLLPVPD